MLDAIGSGDVAERGDRAERHHLALGVARLQIADGVQVLAELAVGLRRDAVGAAEEIEIVDVLRAEIDLERLEHVVGVDAQHLGAHAVDIGVDLRRAWC